MKTDKEVHDEDSDDQENEIPDCTPDCPCFACQFARAARGSISDPQERLEPWREGQLLKNGWYTHFGSSGPFDFTATTRGLERYGHRNFQIVLPLNRGLILSVLGMFVEHVKNGQRFEPNTDVSRIIVNNNIRLLSAREDGVNVLRVIFPDNQGNLDPGSMDKDLAKQHRKLNT